MQPDWFEVTEAGVGTNRYSYSFNDPVNLSDPLGNDAILQEEDGSYKDTDGETVQSDIQIEVDEVVKHFSQYDTTKKRKMLAAPSNAGLRNQLLNQAAARSGEVVLGRDPSTNIAIASGGVAGMTAMSRAKGSIKKGLPSQRRNQAEIERDNLANENGRKAAAYSGGQSGTKTVAGCSDGRKCAEQAVAEQIGTTAQFTKTVGWRRNKASGDLELVEIPVCSNCQLHYNKSQFPPDVKYDPGGLWDNQ